MTTTDADETTTETDDAPTVDGRDPATLIPAAVEEILRLAATWLAWDGGTDVVVSYRSIVFRHYAQSANFAYYDGHVELLRASDIDGMSADGVIGWPQDARLLLRH